MASSFKKQVDNSLKNKGILDVFIRALGPLLFSPKKDEVVEGIRRIAGEGAEAAPRSGLQRQMAETGSYGAGVRDLGTQTAPPSPLPPSVQRLIPQPPGYLDNPIRSGVVTDSVDRVEPAVRSVREMMENPANVAFPRSFGAQQGPTMPGISSPLFEGAFPIGRDTNQLRLSFQYPAGTVIDGKKVGGILLHLMPSKMKKSSNKIAILGIGINIAWGTNNNQFNASALYDCIKSSMTFDASNFFQELTTSIDNLDNDIILLNSPMEFNKRDILKKKYIKVAINKYRMVSGINQGIDIHGNLLIKEPSKSEVTRIDRGSIQWR